LKGHAFAGVLALPPSITLEMVHQERGCYHVLVRSTTIMLTLSTATGGVDFLSPRFQLYRRLSSLRRM